MADTKQRLRAAALRVLAGSGVAGLSARAIAAEADANQALIFYHFGTVDGLVGEACRQSVDERIVAYGPEFDAVQSVGDLLSLGERLHEHERALGNVAVMAQLMAGAQHNEALRDTARYAMATWSARIETVMARVLAGNPVADLVDVRGLARAVSAGFIGLELYEGVDQSGGASALDGLRGLVQLVDALGGLGPTGRRAVREVLRRATRRS